MKLRTIENVDIAQKRVIMRVDWNVTLGKALEIVDDTRIIRTLPTIKWLFERGAKQIVLISHIGKASEQKSIASVAKYAEELIGREIILKKSIEELNELSDQLMMLENVRLWPGEDNNDPEFARKLSTLGEIYVNDAFGECHRESASIVGITNYLPSYAGLWLVEEVETILKVRDMPEHPMVVVMGGAKVEDKLPLLNLLSKRADTILVGGKLANELVKRNIKLEGESRVITPLEGSEIYDIGQETIRVFSEVIAKAKTIVWNGPMGMVEDAQYKEGTRGIFEAITANELAYTLVGGGDTLAAIGSEEQLSRIDHVSTGGGAMLALLEKGELVGIDPLKEKSRL